MITSRKSILVLFFFILNLLFFLQDAREPMDLGHYYQQLPDWIAIYQARATISIWDGLFVSGAWLNAGWALLISLGLMGKLSFVCFALFWLGIFLFQVRKLTIVSLSLLLMMPIWSIGTRTAWLHFIELCLLLVLWNTRKQKLALIFCALLLVWLRPTALVWLGMIGLFWLLEKDWQKVKFLAIGSFLGFLMIASELPSYVLGKTDVLIIERPLWQEISAQCFRLPFVLSIFGLLFLFRFLKPSRKELFLLGAIFLALGLSLGFGVGLDNFLPFHFSLVILGGKGLLKFFQSKKWERWGERGVLGMAVLIMLLPLCPRSLASLASVPLHESISTSRPWEVLRIQKEALGVSNVASFFEEICQDRWQDEKAQCRIVSSSGLFHPMREEDGALPLTLSGFDRVRLSNAGLWWTKEDLRVPEPLQGVVLFDCPPPPDQQGAFAIKREMLREIPKHFTTREVGKLPLPNCPVRFLKIEEKNQQGTLRMLMQQFSVKN